MMRGSALALLALLPGLSLAQEIQSSFQSDDVYQRVFGSFVALIDGSSYVLAGGPRVTAVSADDGSALWEIDLEAPSSIGEATPFAAATGGGGGTFIAGGAKEAVDGVIPDSGDAFALSLNGDGTQNWRYTTGFGGNDWFHGACSSGSSALMVAGTFEDQGTFAPMLFSLDAEDGSVQWTYQRTVRFSPGPQGKVGVFKAIDCSSTSSTVVVGGFTSVDLFSTDSGTETDFMAIAFDGSNEAVWEYQSDEASGDSSDECRAVAIMDSASVVVLAGVTQGDFASEGAFEGEAGAVNMAAVALDISDGTELWRFQGLEGDSVEIWSAVALADGRTVVLGGHVDTFATEGRAADSDAFLVGLDVGTGEVLWTFSEGTSSVEQVNGLAALTASSVVMSGYTEGSWFTTRSSGSASRQAFGAVVSAGVVESPTPAPVPEECEYPSGSVGVAASGNPAQCPCTQSDWEAEVTCSFSATCRYSCFCCDSDDVTAGCDGDNCVWTAFGSCDVSGETTPLAVADVYCPSDTPTPVPTATPTAAPTVAPTVGPSVAGSTPAPTAAPSPPPTVAPTAPPTAPSTTANPIAETPAPSEDSEDTPAPADSEDTPAPAAQITEEPTVSPEGDATVSPTTGAPSAASVDPTPAPVAESIDDPTPAPGDDEDTPAPAGTTPSPSESGTTPSPADATPSPADDATPAPDGTTPSPTSVSLTLPPSVTRFNPTLAPTSSPSEDGGTTGDGTSAPEEETTEEQTTSSACEGTLSQGDIMVENAGPSYQIVSMAGDGGIFREEGCCVALDVTGDEVACLTLSNAAVATQDVQIADGFSFDTSLVVMDMTTFESKCNPISIDFDEAGAYGEKMNIETDESSGSKTVRVESQTGGESVYADVDGDLCGLEPVPERVEVSRRDPTGEVGVDDNIGVASASVITTVTIAAISSAILATICPALTWMFGSSAGNAAHAQDPNKASLSDLLPSARGPIAAAAALLVREVQFMALTRTIASDEQDEEYKSFSSHLGWINVWIYEPTSCKALPANSIAVLGGLLVLMLVHILVVAIATSVWLSREKAASEVAAAQRNGLSLDHPAVLSQEMAVRDSAGNLSGGVRPFPILMYPWLSFPHVELLYLIFVYEGNLTVVIHALRACGTPHKVGAVLMLLLPVGLVLYTWRVIKRSVESHREASYREDSYIRDMSFFGKCKAAWRRRGEQGSCLDEFQHGEWVGPAEFRSRDAVDARDSNSLGGANNSTVSRWDAPTPSLELSRGGVLTVAESGVVMNGHAPAFTDFTSSRKYYLLFICFCGAVLAFIGAGALTVGGPVVDALVVASLFFVESCVLLTLRPFTNTWVLIEAALTALVNLAIMAGFLVLLVAKDLSDSRRSTIFKLMMACSVALVVVLALPLFIEGVSGFSKLCSAIRAKCCGRREDGEDNDEEEDEQRKEYVRSRSREWYRLLGRELKQACVDWKRSGVEATKHQPVREDAEARAPPRLFELSNQPLSMEYPRRNTEEQLIFTKEAPVFPPHMSGDGKRTFYRQQNAKQAPGSFNRRQMVDGDEDDDEEFDSNSSWTTGSENFSSSSRASSFFNPSREMDSPNTRREAARVQEHLQLHNQMDEL